MSENQKHPGGRPTKYKQEYCEKLIEYFNIEPYEERLKKVVTKSGDVIEIPEDVPNDMPSLAGFAIKIGVHRDTLHEWANEYPEFSDVYKRAKDFQENYLIVNGNKGLISAPFGIFTAKNILKWRDKQPDETEVVVNNVNTMSEVEIDSKINKLMENK